MIKDYKRLLINNLSYEEKATKRNTLEELKKEINNIRQIVNEYEQIIEEDEKFAKSQRNGDDL